VSPISLPLTLLQTPLKLALLRSREGLTGDRPSSERSQLALDGTVIQTRFHGSRIGILYRKDLKSLQNYVLTRLPNVSKHEDFSPMRRVIMDRQPHLIQPMGVS
jgi:hypothetical protein